MCFFKKPKDETLEDGRGGAKGTPLWMAPEIMMGRPFTEKVDICMNLKTKKQNTQFQF